MKKYFWISFTILFIILFNQASIIASGANIINISQKEKNLQTMLNTNKYNTSYWNYFVESKRYPYYIYLDNYYNVKESSTLLQGSKSFFSVNISPSLIGLGDKLYNNGKEDPYIEAFEGPYKEKLEGEFNYRSRAILVLMIEKSAKDIFEKNLFDNRLKMAKDLASVFETTITEDKAFYKKFLNSDYGKLKVFIQKIEDFLIIKAKAGIVPTPMVIAKAEEFKELKNFKNIAYLTNALEKKIMNLYGPGILCKKLGLTSNIVKSMRISTSEYLQIFNLYQANFDFIDFLKIIEKNSKTKEVQDTVKNFRKDYEICVYFDIEKIGEFESQSIDYDSEKLSWHERITAITGGEDAINGSRKIREFEKLRLTSDMSAAIEKQMHEYMYEFKNSKNKNAKEDAINSIYKYAPYLFNLRQEGEKSLFEFLKAIGADENIEISNLNNVQLNLVNLYNTLYKDICPKLEYKAYKIIPNNNKLIPTEFPPQNNILIVTPTPSPMPKPTPVPASTPTTTIIK